MAPHFSDFGTGFAKRMGALGRGVMEADEQTKNAVQVLVNAVQSSVNTSDVVQKAVEDLQFMGYVPNFTVRMDLELLRPSMEGLTDTKVRVC